ncbi:MAG TPA: MHYT domain-containing protein [Stellaceae bacterium]|nr:MHYT domain-containing protein [Stellaceae bacterium]
MFAPIYLCITQQHDLRLVVLAAFLCLFSCFTTSNLFTHAGDAKGAARHYWHGAAAIVFGAGVWATHFVAELAYKPGVPVGYDFNLTALSIAIAILVTWIGMVVALHLRASEVGGAIIGAAICSMHYVGMAALRLPANIHWNFSYVGLSLAVAICFGAAAFRVLAMGGSLRHRLAATGLLLIAICGLHFIAMAAVVLEIDPSVAVPHQVMAPELLAVAIAAVAIVIITLGLSGSFIDNELARRAIGEAERLAQRVAERTAELKHAQELLLRQERLSALGELTATVARELRNPMSAATNTVYTIKQMIRGSALDLSRPIERLERSISRCERIISDLLDFSNLREIRCHSATLDRWLDAMLDDQKLPEDITIRRRLGTGERLVDFDSALMRRALENVIENAGQALGDAAAPPAKQITVASRLIADQIEISIADNGVGIPASILPKVFEPLFSTRSFGIGLGLAVAKQIVEQHDGRIAIESVEGKGTTVRLRLPLPAAAAVAA